MSELKIVPGESPSLVLEFAIVGFWSTLQTAPLSNIGTPLVAVTFELIVMAFAITFDDVGNANVGIAVKVVNADVASPYAIYPVALLIA